MNNKTKNNISFLCNLLIVIFSIYSLVVFLMESGFGNMTVKGQHMLCYFTVDSNILCAVAALCVLVQNLKGKGISRFLLILKYIATVAVALTFVTVVVFLAPMAGYRELFEGPNLFLHGINPILAIISFTIFEGSLLVNERWISSKRRKPISFKETLWAMIPMVLYGAVYIYQVLVTTWWPDFYGFNSGALEGKWAISLAAVFFGNYIISVVIWALYYSFRSNKNLR